MTYSINPQGTGLRRRTQHLFEGPEVPVVDVQDVDFSYGRVQVLFGVQLQVWRGETVVLLGTNGAGKSTLLRTISGLNVPDRVRISLNGRDITRVDPQRRVRDGVIQVVGGAATFPPLTIEENLRMAGYHYPRRQYEARLRDALDQFPVLKGRLTDLASDLSGGQQQILALAMALIHHPQVLIIDEMSLGLAPVVVQTVLEIIRDLKKVGQTMIIVEQSLNVALSVADRAVFMEKGEVKFEGPGDELAKREDLMQAVFLGR